MGILGEKTESWEDKNSSWEKREMSRNRRDGWNRGHGKKKERKKDRANKEGEDGPPQRFFEEEEKQRKQSWLTIFWDQEEGKAEGGAFRMEILWGAKAEHEGD